MGHSWKITSTLKLVDENNAAKGLRGLGVAWIYGRWKRFAFSRQLKIGGCGFDWLDNFCPVLEGNLSICIRNRWYECVKWKARWHLQSTVYLWKVGFCRHITRNSLVILLGALLLFLCVLLSLIIIWVLIKHRCFVAQKCPSSRYIYYEVVL